MAFEEAFSHVNTQTSSLSMEDKKFIITWCFLGNLRHNDLTNNHGIFNFKTINVNDEHSSNKCKNKVINLNTHSMVTF